MTDFPYHCRETTESMIQKDRPRATHASTGSRVPASLSYGSLLIMPLWAATGWISPLTPSEGCPTLLDWLLWGFAPVFIPAVIAFFGKGMARIALITEAALLGFATLSVTWAVGCVDLAG